MSSIQQIFMAQQALGKNGFSTLFLVIITGFVLFAMLLYMSTTSLWSIRTSIDDKTSMQTEQMVNACAESALEVLREDKNFIGSGSDSINSDTCSYTVTNTGGNNRLINITATIGSITRKLQITTSAFNPLVISSWQQ